jgi:hypothetical protein
MIVKAARGHLKERDGQVRAMPRLPLLDNFQLRRLL